MPGHRKLLPRPCPQCGAENGGVQLVFFNHRFYEERTGYSRSSPYHLLRISHYAKNEYNSKSNKNKKYRPTKIWHNFQFLDDYRINYGVEPNIKEMSIDKLFDQPYYRNKHSITIAPNDDWLDYYKKNGWPKFKKEGAHWINKPGLKKCQICDKYVESLKKCFIRDEDEHVSRSFVYSAEHIWLCQECYEKKESGNIRNYFCSSLKKLGYHPDACTDDFDPLDRFY